MVEIVLKVPAIEKLMDYTVSGIGATAGPLFRPLQAYMEGHANRISARADADALAIITQAQADARQYLVAPDADVHGVVEITRDNIFQRIEFQERKRYVNIASVVENAAEALGEKKVIDHEPDHDWTARFFDSVQDVSSEHMQKLWAKVLSGEVESPGQISLRTLDILRNMTQRDAELFEAVSSYVIGGHFVFYGRDYVQRHNEIQHSNVLHLEDIGLTNVVSSLERIINWRDRTKTPLSYQNGDLLITRGPNASQKLRIPAVLLTTTGKELFRIAQGAVQMAYLQDFSSFLHQEGCHLSFLRNVETLSDGKRNYTSCTKIEPRPIQPGMPVR